VVIYELVNCIIPDHDHFDYHNQGLHGSGRIVGKCVSNVTSMPVSKIVFEGKNVLAYTGKK
jgi:hypothetical protein